jgi:hypothetical protein
MARSAIRRFVVSDAYAARSVDTSVASKLQTRPRARATTLTARCHSGSSTILAELDRLPVSQRAIVGRYLFEGLAEVADIPAGYTYWRMRHLVGGRNTAHLAFGVCSAHFSEMHKDGFSTWVQLRHHELQQITGEVDDLTTVAVVLTPRSDGVRSWDTTMIAVSGDLGLTEEEVETYRELWTESLNAPDPRTSATMNSD